MTWWKKVLNGVLIAISGYEIGKELNTEKKIVKYEPTIQGVTKQSNSDSESWPINGNLLFILVLILLILLICARYYIKAHLNRPRSVAPRI